MKKLTTKPNEQIVLFDGVCKLCSFWARFLTRFDQRMKFKLATVQSKEGQYILKSLGMPTDHYTTMVFIADQTVYTHSTALLKIIKQLPPPWPLLCIGYLLPRPVRDWLYLKVAKNRYRLFGQYQQCMIPDEKMKQRIYQLPKENSQE